MKTTKEINEMNQLIVDEIKRQVTIDVPTDCLDKLNNLVCFLGNSTECISRASYILNEAKIKILESEKVDKLSPNEKKMFIEAKLAKEVYCVQFSENVNKDLHYAIEGMRSIVSAQKEEFKQSQRN